MWEKRLPRSRQIFAAWAAIFRTRPYNHLSKSWWSSLPLHSIFFALVLLSLCFESFVRDCLFSYIGEQFYFKISAIHTIAPIEKSKGFVRPFLVSSKLMNPVRRSFRIDSILSQYRTKDDVSSKSSCRKGQVVAKGVGLPFGNTTKNSQNHRRQVA